MPAQSFAESMNKVYRHPAYLDLNPEEGRLMTAVPLRAMNVCDDYGLQTIAVIPCKHKPFRTLAMFGMLKHELEAGKCEGKDTLVVTGNLEKASIAASLASAFGFNQTKVVARLGAKMKHVALAAPLSVIETRWNVEWRARVEAWKPRHHYLDTRGHQGAVQVHEQYTAPEVHRCLRENALVIAVPMGDGTLVSGIGRYFKQPGHGLVTVVGVRQYHADPRSPWVTSCVDTMEEVTDEEVAGVMHGLQDDMKRPVGVASARAYFGLRRYLLSFSRLPPGMTAGFLCPDS